MRPRREAGVVAPKAGSRVGGPFDLVSLRRAGDREPWTDWDAGARADAIEIYSGDTMLRDAMHHPAELVCAGAAYLGRPIHGLMALAHPAPEVEARLPDKTFLCAGDAHGRPPYETE